MPKVNFPSAEVCKDNFYFPWRVYPLAGVGGAAQPNKWIKSRYNTSTDFHPPHSDDPPPPRNLLSQYPSKQDSGHYNVCVLV